MAQGLSLERASVLWLHVVREHSVFLKNYEYLFDAKNLLKIQLKRNIRARLYFIRQLFRSIFFNTCAWSEASKIDADVDVLFISHLTNESLLGQEADAYFGDLPSRLQKQGFFSVVALIDHLNLYTPNLSKKWEGQKTPRLIFSNSLGLNEERKIWSRLKKESSILHYWSEQVDEGLQKTVLEEASKEALTGEAHATLRMAVQVKKLISTLRPKVIIVTYEGHAWEKLVFSVAKEVDSKIATIGYQHAAIFKLQHSIRQNLAPDFMPDLIFTSGDVGLKQLQASKGLKRIPKKILGSSRGGPFQDSSLAWKNQARKISRIDKMSCLILPEGIESESILLFEFSLKCAIENPQITFVWRLHPILNFERLIKCNSRFDKLPDNVVISIDSMDEDLKKCSWALYRGTTAIVSALKAGLGCVYLELDDELNIDPLYELQGWRRLVRTPSEFIQCIQNTELVFDKKNKVQFEVAFDYCNHFYNDWDESVLIDVIKNQDKTNSLT